jgi:hypothetical protein
MASNYKVLGRLAPAANTATTLYTVPAQYSTVVSTLMICNQTTTASTYAIAVRPSGATLDPKHYIAYNAAIPAQDTVGLTIGLTMATTDVITVSSANSSTSFNLFGSEILSLTLIDYIVVAGGGGGGSLGSGGGAGGVLANTLYVIPTSLPGTIFTITVGSGGPGATGLNLPGSAGTFSSMAGSLFATLTSNGGGRGGGDSFAPTDGGSGGGAQRGSSNKGIGTVGPPRQGYDGGVAGVGAGASAGPGGGGAGAVGGDSSAGSGGAGGIGYQWVDGIYYAGGGGGGNQSGFGTAGAGGQGGGGAGAVTTAGTVGTPNTGGGGGSGGYVSGWLAGGSGGSGIVIIRYPDSTSAAASTTNLAAGYPIVSGGYRTYKWITSGTITF